MQYERLRKIGKKAVALINTGVKEDVNTKIIDFLTRMVLADPHFQANPHARIKYAYIKALRIYEKLSKEEKEKILKKVEEE